MLKEIIFQDNFLRFAWRISLWHIRYILKQNNRPLACGFYITSKCNFRCAFCNIWQLEPGFQAPFKEAKELIKELGMMGLLYFSFSGGEPLLVPYIFELLGYAKKAGITYTHIVSNGYLLDEAKAKLMREAKLSEVSFSLDGEENFHDTNRNTKGAFNKVIESVGQVRAYSPRTKIVLNAILDPYHPEHALFAIETAERLRLKIKVQPLNEHPSFGEGNPTMKLRPALEGDKKKNLLSAIELMQKSPSIINSRAFLENYKNFIFSPQGLIYAKDRCIFGYHHLEVFADQVFPCLEGSGWKDGFTFSNNSLKRILASNPYQKKLQGLKKCISCRKNYYVCYYEPRLNFPVWNFIKSRC